jgi:hypothetical protein
LFFEHSDLLPEVFDDGLLVAVHPTGNAYEKEWQGIHGIIIAASGLRGEQFPR